LRGAGGEGLAGMKWRSPSPADNRVELIRPLLDVSRAELEKHAEEYTIPFRKDATNASREILRNRIRHELLPLVRRRFQPALNQSLLRAMEIVGAESELVESIARKWLTKQQPTFARLPVAVQRRVVQLQLRRLKLTEDFELIESLRLAGGKPVTIGPEVAVERDARGRLLLRTVARERFQPASLALELVGKAGEATLGGLHMYWKMTVQTGARFRPWPGCEQFDADKVGRRIVLRHWRPGDRFQPIGLAGTVKLQDWFTNQKVPRAARRRLVVACTAAGEVFWVENQRIGDHFKLGPETKRRLSWTWRRG
jgi:tRNA(Ile)-lysidine synthase